MRILQIVRFAALLLLAIVSWRAAATPPLEAYGELPAVERLSISPSGERYATLITLRGERIIGAFSNTGKLLNAVIVGDLKVRSLEFVSEDIILFERSVTKDLGIGFAQDKFEFYQAAIMRVSGGEPELVFSDRSRLLNAVFSSYGTRIVNGRPMAYYGAIELARSGSGSGYYFQHGRPALYEVDLEANKSRKVDASPGEQRARSWLVDQEGEVLARFERSNRSGKWEISNNRGQTLVSGQNPAGGVWFVTVGQGGQTIVYGNRNQSDGVTWYEIPVDGSSGPREFLPDEEVDRVYRDRSNGQMIGYLRDSGAKEPVFFDAEYTKKAKAIRRAFPDLSMSMVEWTKGLKQVLVYTAGNQDSGTFYRVDLDARRADPIGYARPAIMPEDVGLISTLPYAASDGLEMDGILTLPPGAEAKNLPLVMLPHGGPHSHDTASFDWWAQAFASRGYAVFQPNFRGSTNRDYEFIQAGYGEWGGKMQSDISDGMAELAKRGVIDPSRACIVGASYGGYAALAGVTLQNGLYRCAVSVNGVSDVSLMSRIERRETGKSRVHRKSFEEQLGDRSRYKEISPRFHAAKADAPILLIHGREDTVVAFQQSDKMADALKDAGKPYEFVELEGEDHWLSLADTRLAMLKATVAFVEKHNPPD